MDKKKIIIIGAGPGGLTSAMILAKRGFEVTVFERKDQVGGRNAGLKLGPYTFDTGPTFLMMNFILNEMFQEAGARIDDYLKFHKLDPLYRLKFRDKEFFPSSDPDKMSSEISRVFPGNEAGFKRYLVQESKRYEMLFPCLQKDYATFWTLFSKPLLKAIPYLALTKTLFQNLGTYFQPDQLKLAFTFQAKYIGMSPWECPALFTLLSYVEHGYGVYHVQGGLHRISEAMAKVVQKNGGKINLNTEVKSLILENRTAKGVLLASGEKVFADEIMVNADFAHAMTHLVDPGVLSKYSREKLAKKDYSCSTFMMYLGLDKRYDIPHHNIVFAQDYRTNVDNIFKSKKLTEDMSIYIQNACTTDPELAPAGHSTIYILVPVPNLAGPVEWPREQERFADLVLDTIVKNSELKDIRQHIKQKKIITPENWEHDYHVYNGATFNLSHKLSQMLYLRPRNKFEELDNCYLVGGGTHPGSGLPTIYESARISSNMISKKYGIAYNKPSPLISKQNVKNNP
jgi:phytoene desaturase